jgi:type IV pilus assembly protein PilM
MAEAVGIDVGSYAIKLAEVKTGGGGGVQKLASAYNPVGQSLPSDQAMVNKLAETLKQLFTEQKARGKPVHVALPESLAYTTVISMPNLSDAELASSIHWEAEQHIPVPISEINLEYEVLYKPKKGEVGEKMRVLLVGARKDIVNQYVKLFQLAGVEIVGLETVLLGTYRSLAAYYKDGQTALLVHMGALSTDMVVVENKEIVLTYSVQTGGLALTRAIEKGLELPPAQAEEYKRAYGLDGNQLEGKVRQVLLPVLNILVAEIRKAIQYYQTEHMLVPVRAIILSGGSVYLPGIAPYFAEIFGMEVGLANPLETIPAQRGLTPPADVATYTAAIGVAMRPDTD